MHYTAALGASRKTFAILSFSGFDPVVDPKPTLQPRTTGRSSHPLDPVPRPGPVETMPCVVLTPGGDDETPGVHHAGRRRSGVAVRGARATGGDAGDWVSQRQVTGRYLASSGGIPTRSA